MLQGSVNQVVDNLLQSYSNDSYLRHLVVFSTKKKNKLKVEKKRCIRYGNIDQVNLLNW